VPKAKLTEEFISAVRRCAEAGMSANQAAAELSTPAQPITRAAVIGAAHRNEITFTGKGGGSRSQPRTMISGALPEDYVPRPVTATTVHARRLATQAVTCSWDGCTNAAEPGDMFCYQHYRRGLL
jgi:hypothetical protein